MPHTFRSRQSPSPLAFVALLLTAAIFVLDTVTPLEIAVPAFYVAVVLITMRFVPPRGVSWVAAGCIVLAIVSYYLTPHGSHRAGIFNLVIGISAIAASTYLARKLVAAEAAAHEARAQIARLARITMMGELTASIAHEVNQPLTAIVSGGDAGLRWLAADPPNVPRARRTMERMIEDARRASEIIGRVRALTRGAPVQRQLIDPNATAREVLALIGGEIARQDITVKTALSEEIPAVLADPVQIQQVFLNLFANGMDALGELRDRARVLTVTSGRKEGDVAFSVSDTGPGLGDQDATQIFEAFVTSKPGGMGIGLAISRSIVEAHGGKIWAVPGGGADIRFTLAVYDDG